MKGSLHTFLSVGCVLQHANEPQENSQSRDNTSSKALEFNASEYIDNDVNDGEKHRRKGQSAVDSRNIYSHISIFQFLKFPFSAPRTWCRRVETLL